MLTKCRSTVLTVTTSASAISRLLMPRASIPSTSSSRGVKPAGRVTWRAPGVVSGDVPDDRIKGGRRQRIYLAPRRGGPVRLGIEVCQGVPPAVTQQWIPGHEILD